MIVADLELALLSDEDLATARSRMAGVVSWAQRHGEAALERVASSIGRSLRNEAGRRAAGGRPGVLLEVDGFGDDNPDAAYAKRHRAITFLTLIRDDADEADGVRRLVALVIAALAEPSPVARAVEVARLERL